MTCRTRAVLRLAAVVAVAVAPLPAWAVLTYDTPAGTNYAQAPTFDGGAGWQYEGTWHGYYVGTAVGPQYFVTANHVGGSVGDGFVVNGVTYTTTPFADGSGSKQIAGTDLRLWHVDQLMPTYATLWNSAADGDEGNGRVATIFGRGREKGAEVRVNGQLMGWEWGADTHVTRWGQSRVYVNDGETLYTYFDRPGTLAAVANEGFVAENDSGGGVFVKSPVDGKWKLTGIVSGVVRSFSYTADGPVFDAALVDARGLYYRAPNGGSSLITGTGPVPTFAQLTRTGTGPILEGLNAAWAGSPTVWTAAASGTWGTAGNWWSPDGAAPNGAGQAIILANAVTSPTTITLNGNRTVGSVQFDNANRYTIGGTSTLTLSNAGGASVTVTSGSHTIAAPVALASSTTVAVPGGSTLTMSGGITGSAGAGLTKTGAGTVEVRNVRADALAVTDGTVTVLADGTGAGASVVKSLALAAGTTLDLGNNSLIVDYADSNPTAAIRALLAGSYHRGNWDLAGLRSSAAGAATNYATTLGYADNAALQAGSFAGQTPDLSSVLVKYTYVGDANLDGKVDGADLARMTAGGSDWLHGDFNYDGVVNADDYALFNLGASRQGAQLTGVPEPGAVAAVWVGAGLLGLRRRRR